MTTTTSATESFEHVALVARNDLASATQLAPSVTRAVQSGEVVVACVDERRWDALQRVLASDVAARIEYVSGDVRYDTPSRAMKMLLQFVRDAVAAGAPRIHCIGEIHFAPGYERDWLRYESAVNDVLRDHPLRAVCCFDPTHVDERVLVAAAHLHVPGGGTASEPSRIWEQFPAPELQPARTPDLRLDRVVDTPLVRHAVCATARRLGVTEGLCTDVAIVAHELVANALMHAHMPPTVQVWCDSDTVVVMVSDDGPGIVDPYPGLRPPGPTSGSGLWVAAQLAKRYDISTTSDGGTHATFVV